MAVSHPLTMDLRRRFVFRGNAVAFGGRIVRPDDVVFEMPGASSLPVTGGRSVATIPATDFQGRLSFASASTFAEGLFDDRAGAIAVTHRKAREDSLANSTRVRAEVRKLTVGTEKRLMVDRLVAELRSKSPSGSGEPPIATGEILVQGAAIDGYGLKVEIDRSLFRRYDTHAKLLIAADQPDFARKFGDHLFMRTEVDGFPPPGRGRLVPRRDWIYATVVRKITWEDRPNPNAKIDHHTVTVKDFGRIFFGELLITAVSRRLTLIRFEFGSHEGGLAAGPDVDINGSWS